jgi:hypothetical protein
LPSSSCAEAVVTERNAPTVAIVATAVRVNSERERVVICMSRRVTVDVVNVGEVVKVGEVR